MTDSTAPLNPPAGAGIPIPGAAGLPSGGRAAVAHPPADAWAAQPWAPPPPATVPPPGWADPAPARLPAPAAAPPRSGNTLQRAGGAVLAAIVALGKWGVLLIKVGKFGPMLISMAVSVAVLGRLFGWVYGVGLVGLILVHELGHVIAARIERVPASLPFFLGPFGAFIRLKAPPKDARQDAVIGIGGPLLGTAGALTLAVVAATTTTGHTHTLLMALAYFGFFLNLFNLTPMQPFDGGRVAGAVSVWLNLAGVVIMGGLIGVTVVTGVGINPFVVIIFLMGCFTTWNRFKLRKVNPYTLSVPMRTRVFIASAWVALIAVCAVGMSVSHRLLVEAGAVDPVATDSATGSGGAATLAQARGDLGVVMLDARGVLSACDADVRAHSCAGAVNATAVDAQGITAEVAGSPAPPDLVNASRRLEDDVLNLRSRLASGDAAAAAAVEADLAVATDAVDTALAQP